MSPTYSDVPGALAALGSARDWFAEGAIEGNAMVTLSAPEKSGKSWIADDLVAAVQLGDSWLGRWPVRRTGGVLYLDAEHGVPEWTRRYAAVLRGRGITALADQQELARHVRHYESEGLMLEEGDGELGPVMRDVHDNPPALIVVDPYRNHLPSGASENDAHVAVAAFKQVALLRDNAQCPVLVLHHVNKAGGVSGSRAFGGRGDLNLLGESQGGKTVYTASGKKCRPGDTIQGPWTFRLAHEADENDPTKHAIRWTAVNPADSAKIDQKSAADKAWIAKLLKGQTAYANGATNAEKMKTALNCSGTVANRVLAAIRAESAPDCGSESDDPV